MRVGGGDHRFEGASLPLHIKRLPALGLVDSAIMQPGSGRRSTLDREHERYRASGPEIPRRVVTAFHGGTCRASRSLFNRMEDAIDRFRTGFEMSSLHHCQILVDGGKPIQ